LISPVISQSCHRIGTCKPHCGFVIAQLQRSLLVSPGKLNIVRPSRLSLSQTLLSIGVNGGQHSTHESEDTRGTLECFFRD
jgi:hypothetical protein